ncbi:MAG: hypothetical protein H6977_12150 [Gammaproteobacteria bacterium]|nr:hypothetical protein [Gammaproteobacteria bacterium]MCP5200758.1 hypothetical protein [Gammaproteobacteria bacterium]
MAPRRVQRPGAVPNEFAVAAARHLAAGEADDFDTARRRAARDLGLDERRDAPDNRSIQRALAEHLALFEREELAARLARLRGAALRALEALARFDARLVGPVWYGTATASTPITLHLASDEPEAVTRFLLERRIPYHLVDRHCRFPRGDAADMPCFEVEIAGEAFDLVVFPTAGSRRMPLSSLDDKPVRRVAAAELGALLDSGQLFTDGLAALG